MSPRWDYQYGPRYESAEDFRTGRGEFVVHDRATGRDLATGLRRGEAHDRARRLNQSDPHLPARYRNPRRRPRYSREMAEQDRLSIAHGRALSRRTDLQPGQAERSLRMVSYYRRHRQGRTNPLGLPRRILGVDSRLAAVGALVLGWAAFQRRRIGPTFPGFAARPANGGVFFNPSTGAIFSSTRPSAPPAGASGVGEWVAMPCPDAPHTSCWVWQPLSNLALSGVPAGF